MEYEDGVMPATEALARYEQAISEGRFRNLCRAVSQHIRRAAEAGNREIAIWEAVHGGASTTSADRDRIGAVFKNAGYRIVWRRSPCAGVDVQMFCW